LSLGAFAPAGLTALAGFAAAAGAGFLRPEAPVRTGGLVFAPTAVVSVLAMLGTVDLSVPTLAFGLVTALTFSLVAAHLGAGLAGRAGEHVGEHVGG
ncbi:MAG TPA: hypothetical protein VFO65_00250, partial [Acidimicrobiales bacterium]|nr:hypothetical protein [Acidimicrobiales bacterium]